MYNMHNIYNPLLMSFPTSIIPTHPLQNGKKLADHYNAAIYYYRQVALIRDVQEDLNKDETQDQFIATMDHAIQVHAKVQRERFSTNMFESQPYKHNGFYAAISSIVKNKLPHLFSKGRDTTQRDSRFRSSTSSSST